MEGSKKPSSRRSLDGLDVLLHCLSKLPYPKIPPKGDEHWLKTYSRYRVDPDFGHDR